MLLIIVRGWRYSRHIGDTFPYVGARPGDRFVSSFYEFMLVTDFRSLDVDEVTCKGRSAGVKSTHVDETLQSGIWNMILEYSEYPIFSPG